MKKLTSEQIRTLAEWEETPSEERITQNELAKQLGITAKTIIKWRNAFSEGYDSVKWLSERTPNADKALLKAVQGGNAQAIRTFYQLLDRLTDKSEKKVIIEFNADDLARSEIEAERRIKEAKAKLDKGRTESL